jgi:hypothetical protein
MPVRTPREVHQENDMETFRRLAIDEEEMVEWALVSVVFALACSPFFDRFALTVDGALGDVEAGADVAR